MKLYWADSLKFSDKEMLRIVAYLAGKKYWYHSEWNRSDTGRDGFLQIEDTKVSLSKIINKYPAADDSECHIFVKVIWTAKRIEYI